MAITKAQLGATALTKVLGDKKGGAAVKLTVKEFQALESQITKIAKANPKIAMNVAKLLIKKHNEGQFDIKDIRGIPSHGTAVSNALQMLKRTVDLADGIKHEDDPILAK